MIHSLPRGAEGPAPAGGLDQADLHLRPAQGLDVEGQEDQKLVTVAPRNRFPARMGDTSDYRVPTIDGLLRRALARGPDGGLSLTLDPRFQGLPDTAHGGTVLAAFDALAEVPGPRRLRGTYRKRVPLEVPLRLEVSRAGDGVDCRLSDQSATLLADGRVEPVAHDDRSAGGAGHRPALSPLPVSTTCFACGVDNAIGLQVRLGFDETAVGGTWAPREPFRTEDGWLASAALTALLDETAFWLGALASGESGMTTELAVDLRGPLPFGPPLVVHGRREAVRPRGEDARYWDTEVVATDAAGAPVASARITFVAVRGAARRLVNGLLAMNPPEVVGRVFPAYTRPA